ncbi:MAG: serine/threonine protein phosphatase [Ruminococcaceae bacterium]|nr:serine/threonine protein phosphatase [Oscillospiraceae bacterium]
MAIYSIADLHLSGSVDKPMDVFGHRWQGYFEKIETRWRAVVEENDTVVVPGDISWAMTLDEAETDLRFIDSLPGKKLIGKGNHDFWWQTMTKMNRFLEERDIRTIRFLYNNAYAVEDKVICGTRGWYVEEKFQQKARNNPDYDKIVAREAGRLELCLAEAENLCCETGAGEIVVYFHFPPVFGTFVCRELVEVMQRHEIKRCFYGHIHGVYNIPYHMEFEGIDMTIISADYLDFVPMRLR